MTVLEKELTMDGARDQRDDTGSDAGAPGAGLPLAARVEALLLSTEKPLSDGRIADILAISLEDGGTKAVRDAVDELNAMYAESGRAFRIEQVAGGRQILTLPAFGGVLHRLHQAKQQMRLTPAALETLAIVAYRQPILRAEIESIRGVASGEVLRGLMERRLVKITGRAEELGRPMLYGTTKEFLRIFGLASLDDLPQAKELREPGVKKNRSSKTPVPAEPKDEVDPESTAPHSDDGDSTESGPGS